MPPADGSIGRQLKTSASALGRAGARPAKVTRGGSAGKRLFGRGVQAGCRGFEGDRGGCLAACASSPHSQLRIYDETPHLEPCCAANSSAASIVNCAAGRHQPALDRVWTDRRTFCVRRRLRATARRLGPLQGREVSPPARAAWRSGGHAWCHAAWHCSQNEKVYISPTGFCKASYKLIGGYFRCHKNVIFVALASVQVGGTRWRSRLLPGSEARSCALQLCRLKWHYCSKSRLVVSCETLPFGSI